MNEFTIYFLWGIGLGSVFGFLIGFIIGRAFQIFADNGDEE